MHAVLCPRPISASLSTVCSSAAWHIEKCISGRGGDELGVHRVQAQDAERDRDEWIDREIVE